ncbi:MAG TPA: DUF2723 domain-containing protein [Anaerolineae bacterium]|nr:DUF2723 domain-containing protein [Anaerolineae bacterium]
MGQIFSSPIVLFFLGILVTFLLYWRTTAPSVLPGDSGELQFAAWGFWLVHPTGYPLYLLLGGLWQHLFPFGDPAYRLNLFSAVSSAFAVGVAFLVFWNITRARGAAIIAALTFAASPLVWSQATRAEVYALNTFFIALLTLWGLKWVAHPQPRYTVAFALTFGLSLAHHRMTLLLVPAFAALFVQRLLGMKINFASLLKRAALYGILAALPLLFYLYIPLRAGATPYATFDLSPATPIVVFENSPRGWLSVILGQGFQGALGLDAGTLATLRDAPNLILAQFDPIGIVSALVGFGALFRQRRFSLAAFMLFGFLTFVLFAGAYHIGDIADYYTPALFFTSISIAVGIAFVIQLLQEFPATRNSTMPTIALLAFFALLPLQNVFNNISVQDRSRHTETRTQWESWLNSDIPTDAILLTNDRDEMTPLYYLQLVEHQRPDLIGLFPKIVPDARYSNIVSLVTQVAPSNRPIYTIKPLPALTLHYSLDSADNGLSRVDVTPLAPPQTPSNAVLGNALRVIGYSILNGSASAGKTITLGVQYKLLHRLKRDYTFSLQLFDAKDNKIAQGNDHIPGDKEYPPSKWQGDEILQDHFEVALDPNLPMGNYRVMLRVYDAADRAELGDLTEIGEITIEE